MILPHTRYVEKALPVQPHALFVGRKPFMRMTNLFIVFRKNSFATLTGLSNELKHGNEQLVDEAPSEMNGITAPCLTQFIKPGLLKI